MSTYLIRKHGGILPEVLTSIVSPYLLPVLTSECTMGKCSLLALEDGVLSIFACERTDLYPYKTLTYHFVVLK